MIQADTQIEKTTELRSPDGTLWRAEVRPCPACASPNYRTIGFRGGRAHHDQKGVVATVVACKNCTLLYANPTLIPLSNPYATESSESYFHSHDREEKIRNGEAIAADAERILGRTGVMLELGCGRGESLIGAARRGWEVHGVEMTADFAEVATSAGVKVENCAIQQCHALDQPMSYDVILLGAVLEHLYEPAKTLERVHCALRPGGVAFIDVPNERSLALRLGNLYMRARGRDWCVNLSPTFSPFHVIGFSPASLKRLLNKSGFDIDTLVVSQWKPAFEDGSSLMQRVERLSMAAAQRIGAAIGMGDGIACWAKRV